VLFLPEASLPQMGNHFDARIDVADVIPHVSFCVNRFRGFGTVTPKYGYLYRIGWWLSVSIAVLRNTVIHTCSLKLPCRILL